MAGEKISRKWEGMLTLPGAVMPLGDDFRRLMAGGRWLRHEDGRIRLVAVGRDGLRPVVVEAVAGVWGLQGEIRRREGTINFVAPTEEAVAGALDFGRRLFGGDERVAGDLMAAMEESFAAGAGNIGRVEEAALWWSARLREFRTGLAAVARLSRQGPVIFAGGVGEKECDGEIFDIKVTRLGDRFLGWWMETIGRRERWTEMEGRNMIKSEVLLIFSKSGENLSWGNPCPGLK